MSKHGKALQLRFEAKSVQRLRRNSSVFFRCDERKKLLTNF
jgi:hypothetical protein